MRNIIASWIPKHISNRIVIAFFEFLRIGQLPMFGLARRNLLLNRPAYDHHRAGIQETRGYIEDQNAYEDMHYGRSTIKKSGCEVLAIYNALYTLTGHHPISLALLIEEFEKKGMVLNGHFGTSPRALQRFFQKRGYQTAFTTDKNKFDTIAGAYDCLILTMYNDRSNIMEQVHTIHISVDEGMLTAHNVYCNGEVMGPCPSLTALLQQINQGKAQGIALLGIRRKE